MKAAFWTAIGAMFVPIGVLLVVEVPSWSLLAFWLIVAGLVSFVAGWIYTIVDERRKGREDRLRRKEDELRIRREKASIIVLAFIADGLGVDVSEIVEMEEKHLAEE